MSFTSYLKPKTLIGDIFEFICVELAHSKLNLLAANLTIIGEIKSDPLYRCLLKIS